MGGPSTDLLNITPAKEAPNTTNNLVRSPENKDSKSTEREGEKEEHNGEVMVENEEDTVIY